MTLAPDICDDRLEKMRHFIFIFETLNQVSNQALCFLDRDFAGGAVINIQLGNTQLFFSLQENPYPFAA